MISDRRYRVLLSDYRTPDISGELPFLCSRAGAFVEVYASPNSFLVKNKYVDVWHTADTSSRESYVAGLLACIKATHYDWVVLTEDEALQTVSDLVRDENDARTILPIMYPEHRFFIGSKAGLSRLAERYGILTPRYALYEDGVLPDSVSYPLLLKIDRSAGGTGVYFCESKEVTEETLCWLPSERLSGAVLQQYIQGDTIAVEALFRNGVLICLACSVVTETIGSPFGVSSSRIYFEDSQITSLTQKVGSSFGIHGFGNLTFMREKGSGVLYLVEADTRPNIWFASLRHIGIDFSKAIQQFLSGEVPTYFSLKKKYTVHHFFRDIRQMVITGNWSKLLLWVFNWEGRWKFIPLYDMRLFRALFLQIFLSALSRYGDAHPRLRNIKRAVSSVVERIRF